MDERSMQLLKVMREQLGETRDRSVDAGAAAKSLGMYPETLDRSLLYLVRADYPPGYSCDRQRIASVLLAMPLP